MAGCIYTSFYQNVTKNLSQNPSRRSILQKNHKILRYDAMRKIVIHSDRNQPQIGERAQGRNTSGSKERQSFSLYPKRNRPNQAT